MNHVPAQCEKSHPAVSHPSSLLLHKMFPSKQERSGVQEELVDFSSNAVSVSWSSAVLGDTMALSYIK